MFPSHPHHKLNILAIVASIICFTAFAAAQEPTTGNTASPIDKSGERLGGQRVNILGKSYALVPGAVASTKPEPQPTPGAGTAAEKPVPAATPGDVQSE